MALMNVFVLIVAVVAVVSANPWAKKEAMDRQRKASTPRGALSVSKNSVSEVQTPSLRSDKKLEISTTANWVQYALQDSKSCSLTPHYYYWQATNECAYAEYINNYSPPGLNYVKVGCVDKGTTIEITNTYYQDSNCASTGTVKPPVVVNKVCNKQVDGAFNYANGTYFQSGAFFDQYDMIYGDSMSTSCVTNNPTPWNSVVTPNGQLSMFYEDFFCTTNQIAADLFVSDVCSLTNPNAYSYSASGKITSCSTTDLCGTTWSLFSTPDCSGSSVNICSWVYSTYFCGGESESSNGVTDNFDVYQDCIGNVSSAASLALNVVSAMLMIIASVMSI